MHKDSPACQLLDGLADFDHGGPCGCADAVVVYFVEDPPQRGQRRWQLQVDRHVIGQRPQPSDNRGNMRLYGYGFVPRADHVPGMSVVVLLPLLPVRCCWCFLLVWRLAGSPPVLPPVHHQCGFGQGVWVRSHRPTHPPLQ